MGLQSRVENLDLGSTVCRRLCQLMSPCFITFTRASLLHGHLDSSFWAGYKMSIWPRWEQLNYSTMFLFFLPSRALTSPDPPWFIPLLWRSWVVRRILVHRVIVSLILAPCLARESVIAARRSLVIPPESSLHARKAVLVFARAKMCGHLPLICFIKWPLGEPQASFPQFPVTEKLVRRLLSGRPFPFLWYKFANWPMWLNSW